MKPISQDEQRILTVLTSFGDLPTEPYNITEKHLLAYQHAYVEINQKPSFNLKPSSYRYTRKLAGLTLIKHNVALGAAIKDIKAGIVYVIENPIFPDHYKIGMCVDVEDRLKQYQTYDPYRRFAIKHYDFVLDRRATEERILNSFDIENALGEWVLRKKCVTIFRQLTETYEKVLAPKRGVQVRIAGAISGP